MSNKGVLVYCEIVDGKLTSLATELLGAGSRLAGELGGSLSAVVIGNNVGGLAREVITYGADRVFISEDLPSNECSMDAYLIIMEKIVKQESPTIILMGQTVFGRELAPRLAFRLNTAAVLDCIALDIDPSNERLLMTKPVYGGNAQSIQGCETDPQIATVRMKVMSPIEEKSSRDGEIIKIDTRVNTAEARTKVLDRKLEAVQGVKLEDADVVITGGRGIGGPDGFKQLEDLADIFHGSVGASRPACDNNWVSDSIQIGLTGKIINPDLYIAVAVSGSSQHLSGCSGSKVIIAINKDPDANIFNVAHYGIIADWKKVIPVFTAKVKELVSGS